MGIKVDLGCGTNKRVGFFGVDLHEPNKPDIVADIMNPPIPGIGDGCAEYVLCSHVMEHLPTHGFYNVMREIGRLLKRGGIFEVRVPHESHDSAMIHDHKHVLTTQFWTDFRDKDWFRGKLVIDRIESIPNPVAKERCERLGLNFHDADILIRNAYTEIVVTGHKP